jgi:CDP-diacylglycerol---serine O-phosphatidyltransferase
MRKRDRQAYILILPSLFTTGNLFCGFYSIVHSMHHDLVYASYAILLAGVFDVLDGRVARMAKATSKFGVEYDSIADVVSFGIAPALLLYSWMLNGYGRVGWAGAFFFAACGALRLARFNSMADEDAPKSYFIGLPIPAAANVVAALVIAYHDTPFRLAEIIVLPLAFGLGLLMVSSIRYRSFKDFDLRHRRSFFWLVLLVAMLAFIAIRPELSMAVIFGYYAAWGPFREMLSSLKRLTGRKHHPVAAEGQGAHDASKVKKGDFPTGGPK